MTIKSENPLPRYASGQKSMMDGRTDGQALGRTDNAKTISLSPEIFRQGIIKGHKCLTCTLIQTLPDLNKGSVSYSCGRQMISPYYLVHGVQFQYMNLSTDLGNICLTCWASVWPWHYLFNVVTICLAYLVPDICLAKWSMFSLSYHFMTSWPFFPIWWPPVILPKSHVHYGSWKLKFRWLLTGIYRVKIWYGPVMLTLAKFG